MEKFQNSIEFNEIITDLKNKNFLEALKKIKPASVNYPNENIILKLYAIIYFNLNQWENAIKYYKKILNFEKETYKIFTNIGVSYFKLGKINQSIDAFKNSIKNNPNFGLAHNNLGISYLELGMYEKAIYQFVSALKLNDEDYQAQTNLINTFNLNKPKINDEHPLIEINDKIEKLTQNKKFNTKFENKNIKELIEKSNELIKKYKNNLFLNETQIFRKNSVNLNCGRHFKVFNEFNIIPKYCFSCYKVQINLETVVDLIKLFLIFDKIKLRKNNTRKCIVEVRNKIKGNYKGYIYCDGITEATELKKIISKIITNENIDINNISLKHGCSEFYVSYPSFEEINYNGNEKFKYDQKWDTFEKIIDSREPKRIKADKKIWGKSVVGINLSDILILNNWISYSQIIGDESYKKVYNKKIENNFLKKFLENQLEFRKKQLKS